MTPRPITRDGPVNAPFSYVLGQQEGFTPKTVSAVFDGAGASGAFLPCLSFYTQDGKLLARNFPANTSVAVGSKVEVTFHPFLSGNSTVALPGQVLSAYTALPPAVDFSTNSTSLVNTNYPTNTTFTKQSPTSVLQIFGEADFTPNAAPDIIYFAVAIDGGLQENTGIHVSVGFSFITAVISTAKGLPGNPVPPLAAGSHTVHVQTASNNGNSITMRTSTSVDLTIIEYEPS